MKKLMIFDLDSTLAVSKTAIDKEMSTLLSSLMNTMKVAIISGANWPQFEKQLLCNLVQGDELKNLFLLPTCGTKFYQYSGKWDLLYADDFTAEEKAKIIASFEQTIADSNLKPAQVWGEIVEDRGGQITFSALGQNAPIEEKEKWDPDFAKRKKLKTFLDTLIPEFSVCLGGKTSIDVTKPGIDKAYGIKKLQEILHINKEEMIFVGDALFVGGNDYPVKEAGILCIQVRDSNETKRVIETILAFGDIEPN